MKIVDIDIVDTDIGASLSDNKNYDASGVTHRAHHMRQVALSPTTIDTDRDTVKLVEEEEDDDDNYRQVINSQNKNDNDAKKQLRNKDI